MEKNGEPRTYQIASVQATQSLAGLFSEANEILTTKLDKVMKIFKRRDPEFYNGYLAARGITVAAVTYRFAPEHTFSAQRDDIVDAVGGLISLVDMESTQAEWIDPIVVSVVLSVALMFVVSKLTYNSETATQRLLDLQK